jgi:hypothetical protein
MGAFIRNRTDVSDWLIHFVRDRDPSEDAETAGPAAALEPDASALTVLRAIIDCGGILPGLSMRGGRTTIYGGRPAVCLTEAPLYNFVKYISERNRANRCSHYGVCLPKADVFAAGGRPVIYGLAAGDAPPLVEDKPLCRIIDPAVLPLREQFRYVAYDPNRAKPLDFSHEREWRWVAQDPERDSVWLDGPDGIGPQPALPLFAAREAGGYFSRVGFLVKTANEARELADLLLGYADAGGNNLDTPFSAGLLRGAFVVALEEAERRGVQRIEDLSHDLRIQASRPAVSTSLRQKVRLAVEAAREASRAAGEAFLAANTSSDGHIRDVSGGAWVITYEAATDITSALIDEGLARPMAGQYYIVDAVALGAADQALSLHEAYAQAAVDVLQTQLNQQFYVRSWWD